jgi:hypothetical protein
MWLTVEVFGFTVLGIGVGPRRRDRWITNTDGSFELAPETVEYDEEWTEEEYHFGFA